MRHRRCDLGVDQPVATLDIVVVAAGSYALDQESLDCFDLWERLDAASSRRHLASIWAMPGFARSVVRIALWVIGQWVCVI